MKHVFTRSGGKSRIARKIISLFPSHYQAYTYVEPFLGAGWVWLIKKQSKFTLLNDLDSVLFNAWICVQKYPDELVELLNMEIKHEKLALDYLDRLQSGPVEVPDIRKATQFIMASKLLRGSILDPNRAIQRFAIMKMSIQNLQEQVMYLSRRLSNVWIYCRDAANFIVRVLDLKEIRGHPILFYLDIPYPDTANNYKDLSTGNELLFDLETTSDICSKIDQKGHLFYLSVNSTNETENIAKKYHRHLIRSIEKGRIGDELVITNWSE